MDLQEFVTQTLTQIVEGVRESQIRTKDLGAKVNPHLNSPHSEMGKQGFLHAGGGQVAQVVQFNVALSVIEGTGTKAGIGIFAAAISLGASGESKAESSSISRVKFSVPLSLPEA